MAKHKPKRRNDKKRNSARKDPAHSSYIASLIQSHRFRFAAFFTIACIGLYACIQALPPSFTDPLNEHTAWTLGLLLNALGITVSTAKASVSDGGLAFRIIPECTALYMVGLFLCFIAFYPASVRQKTKGLLMGVPVLYLCNLVRLAATFMATRYDRKLFDVVHVYLGQVFTILVVVLSCILWMKWVDKEGSKQGNVMKSAGFPARFALISLGLFFVWMRVHYWYIRFLDLFIAFGFSLFNYHINLVRQTAVYYETFSIVVFTSLVLATRSIPRGKKIKGLAAGLGFLFLIHLFHRINNALVVYFNFTAAAEADLTLLVVGQYLLPVLYLIYLVRCQNMENRDA
jgi:exosortase H (IPTLxxWG-CTERM-specific)